MAQSFGDGIQLVEVTTNDLVNGEPKRQLWAAAARPVLAVALVLAEVPEGWAAALSGVQLTREEVAALRMQPGEARELKKYSLRVRSAPTCRALSQKPFAGSVAVGNAALLRRGPSGHPRSSTRLAGPAQPHTRCRCQQVASESAGRTGRGRAAAGREVMLSINHSAALLPFGCFFRNLALNHSGEHCQVIR